jgi:hypothetical protein
MLDEGNVWNYGKIMFLKIFNFFLDLNYLSNVILKKFNFLF